MNTEMAWALLLFWILGSGVAYFYARIRGIPDDLVLRLASALSPFESV
jgi:hypothetical protein